MRKTFTAFWLLIALLWSVPAFAQKQTIVTATITDPNSRVYATGTGSANLVCPGNQQAFQVNGNGTSTPIPMSIPIPGINSFGTFTMTLYDVNQIQPNSCAYQFAIQDQCAIANFRTPNIGGASQTPAITGTGPVNLSAIISSYAPPVSPQCSIPLPGPGGTVLDFSAGNLPPLFTTSVANPATHPALSFNLSSAGAFTVFGRNAGTTGAPSYFQLPQTFATVASETTSLPNSRQLLAGTNITFNTATPGQLTINAAGGSTGCAVGSLLDKWVLSIHPNATCYGSVNATWDDGSLEQNLQFGLSNTITGGPNSPALTFINGTAFSVTGDGNCEMRYINLYGAHGVLNCTGTDNFLQDAVMLGDSTTSTGHITATNNANMFDVMCLIRGCEFTGFGGLVADGASTSTNVIFSAGRNNGTRADTASNTSSIFMLGEQEFARSTAGCNVSDNYLIGDTKTSQCTASSSASVDHIASLGFIHTFTANSHPLTYSFALGHSLTMTQNSTTTVSDIGLIGKSLTAANCADYYAIGENINTCANNTIQIGMSATDFGLSITNSGGTHDNVRRTPMVFGSLPTCAAGTEGSFAAITDSTTNTWGATVTGGSNLHVAAYCDGTNWTVYAK